MFYIYILIIFLCLAVSIINETARHRYLWLYFSFIAVSEILIFAKILESSFYETSNSIHILFMCGYFYRELADRKLNKLVFIIISVLSLCLIITDHNLFGINTDIFKSFTFIFLSISWFVNQIKNPNETVIYKKMTFWISSSILLWSTIFIIRVIPGKFFAELDMDFLKLINQMYQIVTIFSYLIFLKSLFCKK